MDRALPRTREKGLNAYLDLVTVTQQDCAWKGRLVYQGQDVSMKTSSAVKETAAFDYFVTTISTRPSRRSMLMPTSFARPSSERSTVASPILRFLISICSRNGGKTGCENVRHACGASIRKPRQDWSRRNTATEDHVCGLQATGYNVGPSPGRRKNPQNSSGNRCSSRNWLASKRPERIFNAPCLNP
jgi:hypothetical protein